MIPKHLLTIVLMAAALAITPVAEADYTEVFGGPTYDANTQTGLTGGRMPADPGSFVNNAGTAVGYAKKYNAGSDLGTRAVRWAGGGAASTELGNLGTSNGYTWASAYAVNAANTAVGGAKKYDDSSDLGTRAVRWVGGGAAATELGHLGTSSTGMTQAFARAVNDSNTAVGSADKYVDGIKMGKRAVRWDGGGTTATELGNLGTRSDGVADVLALAVNAANTVVGYAEKYVDGSFLGERAVRWDAGGAAAIELGNIGTHSNGHTQTFPHAVNAANTVVGYAGKYDDTSFLGYRAVRWDGGGTAATELGNLGTRGDEHTRAFAYGVNEANTTVGYATKYDNGSDLGTRAVRWDAVGTAATELGTLDTHSDWATNARAYAVSDTNTAVGYDDKYASGVAIRRAVMWGLDGVALDLNTLIDPDSGWTLIKACDISEDGLWICGEGLYDPDGLGPINAYDRLWVMQVPEPATLSLLALGGVAMLRRKRH